MSIFEKLGEILGSAFKSIVDAILGMISWKPERLTAVDTELTAESLKPEMFKTEEFKKLIPELKKKIEHSPADIPDWLDSVLGIPSGLLVEPVFEMMTGIETKDLPDRAKAIFHGIALLVDYAILAGILDNVASALSGTLLRKVGEFADRIVAASGISQMLSYGLGTALAPAIAPPLIHAINQQIQPYRLPPESVITAWRRDKVTYEKLFQDLKDQGWTGDRLEVLKYVTLYIPSIADYVYFARRDIFAPEVVEFYDYEGNYPEALEPELEKIGVSPKFWKYHWMAHWRDIEWGIAQLLLHRKLITEEQFDLILRTANYPPGIIKLMRQASWSLPNRIELRMMGRYGLVDKPFLVEQLGKVGLDEEYRSVAADMMLAMGIRMDLSARFGKGWIDAEGVKTELAVSGLAPDVADRMYQWIVKNVSPERVVKERDLTLTDIYKGIKKNKLTRAQGGELIKAMGYDDFEVDVKLSINVPIGDTDAEVKDRLLSKADILKAYKLAEFDRAEATKRLVEQRFLPADAEILTNLVDRTKVVEPDEKKRELTKVDIMKAVKAAVLTSEEGYTMLQDVGYTPKDAEIIFQTKVAAEAGSPDTFGEFNNIVQAYRASIGLEAKPTSLELVQAERDVKATQAALNIGKAEKVTAKRLRELEGAVDEAKIRYHQLLSQAVKKE